MLHVLCALTVNLQDLVSHLKENILLLPLANGSVQRGNIACQDAKEWKTGQKYLSVATNMISNGFLPSFCHFSQQLHPLLVSKHTGPCCTRVLLSGWSQNLYCHALGPQSRTQHPVRQKRTDKEIHQRRTVTTHGANGSQRWVQTSGLIKPCPTKNSQNVNGSTIPWNAWIINATWACVQGTDH